MLRVTFPKEIQASLATLPTSCGLLWHKAGVPKILIKLKDELDFLSARLGHREIRQETDAAGHVLLHLTLVLQLPHAPDLLPFDCHLNPPSLHDWKRALTAFIATDEIEVHAVSDTLTYIGMQKMVWPLSRRQELATAAGLLLGTDKQADTSPTHVLPLTEPATALTRKTSLPSVPSSTDSLFQIHQRLQQQQRHLEYLSVSLRGRRARLRSYEHLLEKDLVRQLHIAEEQTYRHVRMTLLDQAQIQQFAELVEDHIRPAVVWPQDTLWIEAQTALPGYGRPAWAVLLIAPRHRQIHAPIRSQRKVSPLELDYAAKIIDEHGQELLRLSPRAIRSDLLYWGIAPSHQCPTQRCQREASDLPRSLCEQPPLRLCSACQQEADFWREALPPLLALVQKQPLVNRTEPKPKPSSTIPPVRPPTTPAPRPVLPPPVPKPHPAKRRKHISLLAIAPTRPPLSKETLPCMIGIPWPVQETPSEERPHEADLEFCLLLKVPRDLQLLMCTPGYGKMERYSSGIADLLIIHILLRHGTQTLDIPCLICPRDPFDAHLLASLRQEHATTLQLLLISDDAIPQSLGRKALPWLADQRQQLVMHTPLTTRRGDSFAAKAQWISQNPPKRPRLQVTRQTAPSSAPRMALPPDKLPDSLMERYLTFTMHHALELGNTQDSQIQALKRAYLCEIEASAQRKLHQLFASLSHSLLPQLLQLPATHCWFTFQHPLPMSSRDEENDVAALWITKQADETGKNPGFLYRLINTQAQALGPLYCYEPKSDHLWRLADQQQCPLELCLWQDGKRVACDFCQQHMEQWVTLLHLLVRMLRGEYAVCVESQSQSATRLTWTKLNWEQVIVEKQHHVLVAIDVDTHTVRPTEAEPLPRESWLTVLLTHRPELVEKDRVKTVPHTRHLSSGKEIDIASYDLTVYRRKDKKRKRRAYASSEPDVDQPE